MARGRNGVLEGGWIYGVIKGAIRGRERLTGIEAGVDEEGRPCTLLLHDPKLVRTMPRQHRPFQGWRYFEAKDAPPDLPAHLQAGQWNPEEHDGPPPEMAAELRALGLL